MYHSASDKLWKTIISIALMSSAQSVVGKSLTSEYSTARRRLWSGMRRKVDGMRKEEDR